MNIEEKLNRYRDAAVAFAEVDPGDEDFLIIGSEYMLFTDGSGKPARRLVLEYDDVGINTILCAKDCYCFGFAASQAFPRSMLS
jgi:hypothetical protein